MKKVLSKENLEQVLKISLCVLCCVAIVQAVRSICPTLIACDDLFDVGLGIISDAQQKLVEICIAICPLALIFVIVCVLLTHNEKKMAWYMQLGIIILVATALVLIINSGVVIETLKAWFS